MKTDDRVEVLTIEERGHVDMHRESPSAPDADKTTKAIPGFTDQSRVLPPKELAAVFAG
jgi:hypothetical protein